jgi:predicted ATPase/class 3 adenylate cyclase
MVAQPTGTVTLLFTDVEGSTQLLGRLGTARYSELLELHRRLLREAFARHSGFEVGTEGDSFFVAFQRAEAAVAAAAEAQQALAGAVWPDGELVRVRMGVHTGEPTALGGNYVGMDVHQAARIMSAGRGGQVLVSETTAGLLDGVALRDLGPHRLKDLLAPIRLYQLEVEGLPAEFSPLRSLHQTNLPVAAWPLLGREQELEEIRALVATGVRLLTLTGPGGSGKTRLSLQAAAELSEEFTDGVFFVALAPLRDTAAVQATVAEAVGLPPDDDVAAWLASRRVLLVLDNLEHLPGVAAIVGGLLVGETAVLATSRMPLRLSGERELPVEPLPLEAAVELFVSRAAAAGRAVAADATVAAVCRRLDNLPLALELAAARAKLLSPAALLQRLETALPLLTGGAHDLPERQRTLRATIEWSYDLLDSDAQAVFRRLSVFRGSFTLEAAEAVTGADLDQIATLLDQSLLKPLGDDRFFMLETLREFAREQLDRADETTGYGLRHARYYLSRLEEDAPAPGHSQPPEFLPWCRAEEDNLRAMLDRLEAADVVEAARAARLLHPARLAVGAYREQRDRLTALLAHKEIPEDRRASILNALGEIHGQLGDLDALDATAQEALQLAEPGTYEHGQALIGLAWGPASRGDAAEAVQLAEQAIEESTALDAQTQNKVRGDAAIVFAWAGHSEKARAMFREVANEARRLGNEDTAVTNEGNLAELDLDESNYEAAHTTLATAIESLRRLGDQRVEAVFLRSLGLALVGLERRREARETFARLLDFATREGSTLSLELTGALDGIALAADRADAAQAAHLRGASATIRANANLIDQPHLPRVEHRLEQPLTDALGPDLWESERAAGAALTLEETIALARSLAATASETTTTPA